MDQSLFKFDLIAEDPTTHARAGVLHTPHGDIETPIFMPVGTKANVKGIPTETVKQLGAQIVLANTYHLSMRPGEDTIAELGKNGGWADNEAAVTAAQEIIDFVNAGYLAEGAPDAYPASQTKVGLGTAAMVACANYVTSEVDAAVGEPVNWGFFNYPEVEGNVDASAYAGANSLAISSSCENPQAAFDFIMTIVTGTCGQELVDNGGQIPADTRLKESVLAGSVETLKNTTTPMSWCGSLNTLDGWSSIKSSMIELFEGKYATGADYCAYLDTLCG